MSEKKKVLIIGGGYGGISAAKLLDSKFEVTLVERKNYFFHSIASVRLAVEPELVNQVYIPYDNLLKNGKVIHSIATEITPTQVTLENGQQLQFDYLIIATGSNTLTPFKAPTDLKSNGDIKQYFENYSNQIKQSENILIVGGGSVGLEFVGEIYDKYGKDKKITVLHSGSKLVNNTMSDKFTNNVLKSMEKRNVKLILNDRISIPDDIKQSLNNQSSFLPTFSKSQTYTTENGVQIQADMVVWTVGTKINNESFSNSHFENSINQQGQIKVNSSLQVEGFQNIFAIGDITDVKELKTAYNAGYHAAVAAKVIESLSKNNTKKLASHSPSPSIMLLSLGKKDGILQLPNGMVLGGFVSKLLKSKTLLISRLWGDLNKPKPINF